MPAAFASNIHDRKSASPRVRAHCSEDLKFPNSNASIPGCLAPQGRQSVRGVLAVPRKLSLRASFKRRADAEERFKMGGDSGSDAAMQMMMGPVEWMDHNKLLACFVQVGCSVPPLALFSPRTVFLALAHRAVRSCALQDLLRWHRAPLAALCAEHARAARQDEQQRHGTLRARPELHPARHTGAC